MHDIDDTEIAVLMSARHDIVDGDGTDQLDGESHRLHNHTSRHITYLYLINRLVDTGAISYSEIGTLIPKSGGEYTYFLEAFGPLHKFFGPILSFLFAWVTVLLLKPTSLAINSLSFSKYLLEPILTASGICLDDYLYYVATRITATAFICTLI